MDKVGLPVFSLTQIIYIIIALILSLTGALYSFILIRNISNRSPGTISMQAESKSFRAGLRIFIDSYLKLFFVAVPIIAVCLFIIYLFVYKKSITPMLIATGGSLSFIFGAISAFTVAGVSSAISSRSAVRGANAVSRGFEEVISITSDGAAAVTVLSLSLSAILIALLVLIFGHLSPSIIPAAAFGAAFVSAVFSIAGSSYRGVFLNTAGEKDENIVHYADSTSKNTAISIGRSVDFFAGFITCLISAMLIAVALLKIPAFKSLYGPNAQFIAFRLFIFPLFITLSAIAGVIISQLYLKKKRQDNYKTLLKKAALHSLSTIALITIISGFAIIFEPKKGFSNLSPFVAALVGIVLAAALIYLQKPIKIWKYPAGESDKLKIKNFPLIADGIELLIRPLVFMLFALFIIIFMFKGNIGFQIYGIALSGLTIAGFGGYVSLLESLSPLFSDVKRIYESQFSRKNIPVDEQEDGIVKKLENFMDNTGSFLGNIPAAVTFYLVIVFIMAFFLESRLVQTSIQAFNDIVANINANTNILAQKISTIGVQINIPVTMIGLFAGAAMPFLFLSMFFNLIIRSSISKNQIYELFEDKDEELENIYKRIFSAHRKETWPIIIMVVVMVIFIGFGLGPAALGAFLAGNIISGILISFYMLSKADLDSKAQEFPEASVISAYPVLPSFVRLLIAISLSIYPLIFTRANIWRIKIPVALTCIIALGVIIYFASRDIPAQTSENKSEPPAQKKRLYPEELEIGEPKEKDPFNDLEG